MFRTIFAQPDPDTVATTWDQVRDRFPKITVLLDDAKAEVLAFSAFPRSHQMPQSVSDATRRVDA